MYCIRVIACCVPCHNKHLLLCSLAAFLNGGVVVRSSNLAVEGDVAVRAQAMGQSAARVAARQHSIFHGQKKPGEA